MRTPTKKNSRYPTESDEQKCKRFIRMKEEEAENESGKFEKYSYKK